MAEVEKLRYEPEKKLCDVCGRNMVDDVSKTEVVGMELSYSVVDGVKNSIDISPYKLNKKYKICFVCLLSKLGVKP